MPELEGLSRIGANVTPYCPAGARPFPRLSAESGKRAISTSGARGPDDRSLMGSGGGSLLMPSMSTADYGHKPRARHSPFIIRAEEERDVNADGCEGSKSEQDPFDESERD